MFQVVYLNGCPKCGGRLDTVPGFTGTCPYCGQLVGHDASRCPCTICEDYKLAQMGLELLDQMKRKRATRIKDGVQSDQPPKPDFIVVDGRVIGGKTCSRCGTVMNEDAKFCPHCGVRQEQQPA